MSTETRAYTRHLGQPQGSGGFTLVELMVAIPIMLILGGVVVVLLYNYINLFLANNDAVSAARRADMALRMLEGPILHAGLGVNSATPDSYRQSWSKDATSKDKNGDWPLPGNWDDAIKIVKIVNGAMSEDMEGSQIGVVYSVSVGLKTEEEVRINDANRDNVKIELMEGNDPLPAIDFSTDAKSMLSWITTPGTDTTTPMLVKEYDSTGRTIEVSVPGKLPTEEGSVIPYFQELFRMKAIWARVVETNGNYELWLTDITNQAAEPPTGGRVMVMEGIRAVRFKLSENRSFVEVRVLAIGDTFGANHSRALLPSLKERWPELNDDDANRYLEEFSMKWRVRNIGRR